MRFLRNTLAFLTLAAMCGAPIVTARAAEASPPASAPVPIALRLARAPQAPTTSCGHNAATADLIASFSSLEWMDDVRRLSGDLPVKLFSGETYTITTRYTPAMYSGVEYARAGDFILDQLRGWGYPEASLEQDAWTREAYSGEVYSGTNLVLTIPGQITPTETVAFTAHLDSYSPLASVNTLAPGAEDNASGSAALLEAARQLRHYQFDRSVRLIWFTGEEQGMLGSAAYVNDHSLSGYQGVVNLDMFGYDADNDRCIELHVGELAASDQVGQCVAGGIAAYNLNLGYDYLTSYYTNASDHSRFWQKGVGAILLHQNGNLTTFGGCNGVRDRNPFYHTVNDTVANSFPPYTAGQPNMVGSDIARAGLAAVAGMAGNRGTCFSTPPALTLHLSGEGIALDWDALPGAAAYRAYRQVDTSPETLVYSGTETEWVDYTWVRFWPNFYRVEALAADGVCLSESSLRMGIAPFITSRQFLPLVKR